MNNLRLIFLGVVALFILATPVTAQKTSSRGLIPSAEYCIDFHKKACKFSKKDLEFKYNSQSKSALFRPGQTSTFTITAFKGQDYRIAIAAEDVLLNGQAISFKIRDAKTNTVLFDSETADPGTDFAFSCDNSLNLRIELQLPEAEATTDKKMLYGCVGFLIESRKTLKTGF